MVTYPNEGYAEVPGGLARPPREFWLVQHAVFHPAVREIILPGHGCLSRTQRISFICVRLLYNHCDGGRRVEARFFSYQITVEHGHGYSKLTT
jgi:hypothetical protein